MEKVMAGVKTYIKAEDKMFYKYQYHTNIPDSTPTSYGRVMLVPEAWPPFFLP